MPYINAKISMKLDEQQKQELVSELGKVITIYPNKTEGSLMIGIEDGYSIYKGGKPLEKAAYMEVKIFGDSDNEVKAKVNEAIFQMMSNKFGIEKDALYINYYDLHSWGFNGRLL